MTPREREAGAPLSPAEIEGLLREMSFTLGIMSDACGRLAHVLQAARTGAGAGAPPELLDQWRRGEQPVTEAIAGLLGGVHDLAHHAAPLIESANDRSEATDALLAELARGQGARVIAFPGRRRRR
ncbi:MAG: hypothetical protein K2X11_02525 [Acetobacteraceae bacterium]|nr:hypothetical protein [Acetobacteraceae bacterium]